MFKFAYWQAVSFVGCSLICWRIGKSEPISLNHAFIFRNVFQTFRQSTCSLRNQNTLVYVLDLQYTVWF